MPHLPIVSTEHYRIPVAYWFCENCQRKTDVRVYRFITTLDRDFLLCPRCKGSKGYWCQVQLPHDTKGHIVIVDERDES